MSLLGVITPSPCVEGLCERGITVFAVGVYSNGHAEGVRPARDVMAAYAAAQLSVIPQSVWRSAGEVVRPRL
jgi:hypothetical protein